MKPDKHLVGALGIILAAIGLIALTWIGTLRAIHVQRLETAARVNATLANQALTLGEQINRQLLALDQTLGMFASAWAANPSNFDLEAQRRQAVILNGISRDMILTDATGIIRQSSVVPAINLDVAATDFFRDLADPHGSPDRMFIGPASISAIMRQWHMDIARALHHKDSLFAGVIAADYRISAMIDTFRQTNLGAGGFITVVGLEDGKMRGTVGPTAVDADVSIADTRMFAAIQRGSNGLWTGPTATDPAVRIHAYRRIPDRPLVLVVAMNEQEAMRPATMWRQQSDLYAVCITVLLIGLAGLLLHSMRLARRRERALAEDQAALAAANAQLDDTRGLLAAKADRLEATLAGMTDGGSMFDGHLRLVERNARHPENAGGQTGNASWGVLPATALPFREVSDPAPEAEVLRVIRAEETLPHSATGLDPTMIAAGTQDGTGYLTDPLHRLVPRTRVLLAAAIPASQFVTATLLRRAGHFVDVVTSGSATVEAVKNTPYDIVLMDIFMQDMDGTAVARMIRSLPETTCSIPILALTADVSEENAAILQTAGMNGIVRKPVSQRELAGALRDAVWSSPPASSASAALAEPPAKRENHDPWAVLSHARIRELRATLPPKTVVALIEDCLTDLDHRMPALRRAVTTANPAAITAHAQAMAGMAAGYGMAALETRLHMILAAVREGDMMTLTSTAVAAVEADLTEAARLLRDVAHTTRFD
jgi:CheY-like chemotaxis protein